MALVMKMDIAAFMNALPVGMQQELATLLASGVEIEFGFYTVILKKGDSLLTVKLPVSTSSLIKSTTSEAAKAMAIAELSGLFADALLAFGLEVGAPQEEAEIEKLETIGSLIKEAMAAGDKQATVEPSGKPKSVPKGPVKLKTAVALGQEVLGTSAGSTYRVVALSERVKLAARINGSNLSVRCEGEPNAYEKGRLSALGFGKTGGSHHSLHMDTTGIPHARVLGALLMDMDIPFDEQAKNLKEVQL